MRDAVMYTKLDQPQFRSVVGSVIIPTDGTDASDEIQANLDAVGQAGGGIVQLPGGDITLHRPVVGEYPNITLAGDPHRQTRIFGTFAGYPVLMQKPRPFLQELGTSVIPGPGNSLRIRTTGGSNPLARLHVTTEPALDLSDLGQMTLRYFLKAEPNLYPNEAQCHFEFGAAFGVENFRSVGIWSWGNNFQVVWGGVVRTAPTAYVMTPGQTYHFELTFDGTTVQLFVGQPGQMSQQLLSFTSPTPKVPMQKNGIEVLSIGYNTNGVLGDLRSHTGPEGWMDSFEVRQDCLHTAPSICPTVKSDPLNPGSRWVCNFERDGRYIIGWRQDRKSFILPHANESHIGNVRVQDIEFMGANGASGPCLHDCIISRIERCKSVQTWHGCTLRGTTFGAVIRDLAFEGWSYGLIQGGQSMECSATNIRLASRGVTYYAHGPVGGNFNGLYLVPRPGSFTNLYVSSTFDFNVYGGQVDDEGQAGVMNHCMIADGQAFLKLNGVLVTRASAGPLIELANGSSACLNGCWFLSQVPGDTSPFIRVMSKPKFGVTVVGCGFEPPTGRAVVDHPEWSLVLQPSLQ